MHVQYLVDLIEREVTNPLTSDAPNELLTATCRRATGALANVAAAKVPACIAAIVVLPAVTFIYTQRVGEPTRRNRALREGQCREQIS